MEIEIPSYMHPIVRFLQANGDLRVARGGAAFNLAGGLLDLDEEDFPLTIRGVVPLETLAGLIPNSLVVTPMKLERDDLLKAAANFIDSGNAVMLGSRHKEIEELVKKWRFRD